MSHTLKQRYCLGAWVTKINCSTWILARQTNSPHGTQEKCALFIFIPKLEMHRYRFLSELSNPTLSKSRTSWDVLFRCLCFLGLNTGHENWAHVCVHALRLTCLLLTILASWFYIKNISQLYLLARIANVTNIRTIRVDGLIFDDTTQSAKVQYGTIWYDTTQ